MEPSVEPSVEPKARTRKAPKSVIPDAFAVSERVTAWAAAKGFGDLDAHLEHFVGKAKAQGYTYADWEQAFMNAIRDDWARLRTSPGQRVTNGLHRSNHAPATFDSTDYSKEA
jgi:hypothetical protein